MAQAMHAELTFKYRASTKLIVYQRTHEVHVTRD